MTDKLGGPIKSNDPRHKQRSAHLKRLREAAGMEQQTLANRLGISRRQVSNIENCHLYAMNKLPVDIQEKWWEITKRQADEATKESFKEKVLNWFRF